jgi:hypothetical protein
MATTEEFVGKVLGDNVGLTNSVLAWIGEAGSQRGRPGPGVKRYSGVVQLLFPKRPLSPPAG